MHLSYPIRRWQKRFQHAKQIRNVLIIAAVALFLIGNIIAGTAARSDGWVGMVLLIMLFALLLLLGYRPSLSSYGASG